jgi:hypothetical protein
MLREVQEDNDNHKSLHEKMKLKRKRREEADAVSEYRGLGVGQRPGHVLQWQKQVLQR